MKFRIGQSTDIHQLIDGEYLVLGGLKIESDKKTLAHSDGDILVHAITEAIIGALGLGDLGTWFDDKDQANKNRSSLEMLDEINEIMKENNYVINNIDSIVIVEKPKVKPYIEDIKKNICNVLNIEANQLNIKATRGEKIGFIGRREGLVAQAIVLLEKNA